jgi:hypothetical protein
MSILHELSHVETPLSARTRQADLYSVAYGTRTLARVGWRSPGPHADVGGRR